MVLARVCARRGLSLKGGGQNSCLGVELRENENQEPVPDAGIERWYVCSERAPKILYHHQGSLQYMYITGGRWEGGKVRVVDDTLPRARA